MLENTAAKLYPSRNFKAFIRLIWMKAFLCYSLCLFGQQPQTLNLATKITEAKSLSDRKLQIDALQKLLQPAMARNYADTVAQIHYALAYRYEDEPAHRENWRRHSHACLTWSDRAGWNHYSYSRCLRYLGDYYDERNMQDSALYYYQKAPDYYTDDWQYYQSVAMSYNRRAIIHQKQYKFWEAINILDRIQQDSIWSYISEDDQGNILLTQAICYASLNNEADLERAIDLVHASLQAYENYDDPAEYQEHLARSLLILGNVYFQLQDYMKAEENYGRVLSMDHELYDGLEAQNNQFQAEIDLTNIYLATDRLDDAKSTISLAQKRFLNYQESWDDYDAYLLANNQLSVLARTMKGDDFKEAFTQALTSYMRPESSVLQLVNNPFKKRIINLLWIYVSGQDSLENSSDNAMQEKLFYIRQIDSIFYMYLDEVALDQSLYFWKEEMAPVYRKAVDIAYQLSDMEAMWTFGEKQKSRYLYQFLVQRSNDTKEQLRQMKARADKLYVELRFQDLSPQDSLEITQQIASIQEDIVRRYRPQSNNTIWKAFNDDGWNKLKNEQKFVLCYISGCSTIYRMSNLVNPMNYEKIASRDSLGSLVQDFLKEIRKPSFDSEWESRNRLLSEILLPEKIPEVESLLIIPDEILSYLPFASLRQESGSYLIENFSISQQLSYALYQHLLSIESYTKEDIIISPTYSEKQQDFIASRSRSDALENLPYAKEEAQAISSMLNAPILDLVTQDSFLSLYERSHILHFTGHAVQYPDDASLAYLALSDAENNIRTTARDISHMRASSTLVSLSACETYGGKKLIGEGVFGLSRAFIQSGTSCVLSTLWELQDQSGMQIMEAFYRELTQQQVPKDKALQLAQLSYLQAAPDHLRHPYYWAGFNLTGNCYSLPSRKSTIPRWSILTAILVSGFYLLRYIYRKSRSTSL